MNCAQVDLDFVLPDDGITDFWFRVNRTFYSKIIVTKGIINEGWIGIIKFDPILIIDDNISGNNRVGGKTINAG